MLYHLKAYGFLFPIKDAVRILELLPGCHGNMQSGVFGHISSLYPIEALPQRVVHGTFLPFHVCYQSISYWGAIEVIYK